MRVRYQLKADEGIMLLKMDLLLGQFEKVVGPFFDVMIGGDKESAGARGGVLDNFARLRLHEPHDAIDERTWGKILPCPIYLRIINPGMRFIYSVSREEPLLRGRSPV
jgi:hypothetical protein